MNDAWYVCYEAKLMLVDVVGMRPDTELAHRRLCDLVWATGKGLVDDDDCLRDACRVKPQDWARVKGELMQKGWLSKDGLFTHRGATRLGDVSRKRAAKRQSAGIAGASARWAENATSSQPIRNANAMRTHRESIATALPPQPEGNANAMPKQCESDGNLESESEPCTKLKRQRGSPKLSSEEWVQVNRIEALLGKAWVNDAGKWVNRVKSELSKSERVINEVESAIKESRIKTTPAQYAEQIWKEFQ